MNNVKYNPDRHYRHSIRLRGYDYSKVGLYFVTICTQHRQPLFGSITNGNMILNDAGCMVEMQWRELLIRFDGIVRLHEYIVMPNHFHGIIEMVGANPCGRPLVQDDKYDQLSKTTTPTSHIGNIIGAFKSITTSKYIQNVKKNDWKPFEQRIWQRNYYEHIIRDESAYLHIANYIQTNPERWIDDCYHFN